MRFILGQQIDHTIGGLNIHRPDIGRRNRAQPATFNHRRPTHADITVFGCNGDIGATEQNRITGKAIAIIHRNARRDAAGLRPGGESHDVQAAARDFGGIGITGPAATAFRIEDGRHLPFMRHFQHAVGLFMIEQALRTGQHRIVIGQNGSARRVFVKHIAIDRAETSDQPISRCVINKVVQLAPLALRRYHQLAIFDKAAFIA